MLIVGGQAKYDGAAITNRGKFGVYVYNTNENGWYLIDGIQYGEASSKLGYKVAMSSNGKTVAVTSIYSASNNAGLVKIYRISSPNN